MVGTIVVWVAVGLLVLWLFGTESGRTWAGNARLARARKRPSTISSVGTHADGGGGLACPKCGGTQFKAGRRAGTKVAFGAMSLLGQAKHVRCVTCGTQYIRG